MASNMSSLRPYRDMETTESVWSFQSNHTNSSTTLSPEIQAQVDYYNGISRGLRLYVTPFILFGGTVGNILTIVVVLSRHFRYSPSSVLLLALAIIDIGVLYFNLLDVWIGALLGGNSLQFTREQGTYGCKFSTFMTYFLTHSSSWILVLINIDRVISVYQPLKARTWCTKKRLTFALLFLLLFLSAVSLHVFWTVDLIDDELYSKCLFDNDVMAGHIEQTWLWIDATIFTFAPFVIIFSCNAAIIFALLRAARRRNSEMNVRSNSAAADSTTSITAMLITISIVFLISTSPLTVCYQLYDNIYARYENDPVGQALYIELLMNTFLLLLCYNNNAVNFCLYCISGSKFRRALADLCGGKKKRRANAEPYTSHTSMGTRSTIQPGTKFSMTDMRGRGKHNLKTAPPSRSMNGNLSANNDGSWKTSLYEVSEEASTQGFVNSQCLD